MRRILRADLYRLARSFMFYSVPVALIASLIISIIGNMGTSLRDISELGDILTSARSMLSSVIFLMVDIVAVLLWNSEHKHGYIKNLAGIVDKRDKLTLSKMTVGTVICLVYTIFSLFYMIVASAVFGGIRIDKVSIGGPVVELLILILAGIASIAIMLLLFELFHSSTVCYIAAIMIWTGLFDSLAIQLTAILLKWENTGRYLLVAGLQWESSGTAEDLIRTLLYLAVSLAAVLVISKKQDVKT